MKFNHEELASMSLQMEQAIHSNTKSLDECSADVKNVEEFFKLMGHSYCKQMGDFQLEYDKRTRRLMYLDNSFTRYVPLIETKCNIRLKVWNFLPFYVKSFMEEFKNGQD